MPVRAAFFDVGDTLVEHWAPRETSRSIVRKALCEAFGELPWYEDFLAAQLEPAPPAVPAGERWSFDAESARQETLRWYADWFTSRGIELDGIDLERLRQCHTVPLAEISAPVPGAFEALRWCKSRGLAVVLVTNTLSRGDREVIADWERFDVRDAIDGVVSSHSVGWRKPHPAIFKRALQIARATAAESFHVGNNLVADVWGAGRLGMRTVWRRTDLDPAGTLAYEASVGELPVDVTPDAIVRDLHELPEAVEDWLG